MSDKTCIMTGHVGGGTGYERFTCSECGKKGLAGDWKFCAYCGAEIVRFVREEAPSTVTIQVLKEKPAVTRSQMRVEVLETKPVAPPKDKKRKKAAA